jgi:hypothetical protein
MNCRFFSLTILFCSLLVAIQAYAFDLSDDVSGSSDYTPIQRYPLSKIENYTPKTIVQGLHVGLGRLKSISGEKIPEYAARLSGSLTRITYRGPDGHSSKDIYQHFKQQFIPYLQEVVYECEGRDCGGSNDWANVMLKIADLYGPDQYQYYQVAKLNINGQDIVVIAYAIRRGNKRIYLQLDMLEVDVKTVNSIDVNPGTIYQLLKEQGRYILRPLEFNDANQLTKNRANALDYVVRMLEKQVRLKVKIVSYMPGSASQESLQKISLQRAEAVVKALIEAGVSGSRLSAIGMGPDDVNKDSNQTGARIELQITN